MKSSSANKVKKTTRGDTSGRVPGKIELHACVRLSANITKKQCDINRYGKAGSPSGRNPDIAPKFACQDCPGLSITVASERDNQLPGAANGAANGATCSQVVDDLVRIVREQFDRLRDEAVSKINSIADDFERLDAAYHAVMLGASHTVAKSKRR